MAQKLSRNIMAELGGAAGTGLGAGLQSLTQQLVTQKAMDRLMNQQRLQQAQYAQSLASLGVPEREAFALASLPEKERLAYIQRGGVQGQAVQPMQAEDPVSALSSLLQNLSPEQRTAIDQGMSQGLGRPVSLSSLMGQQGPSQPQRQMVPQRAQPTSFLEVMSRPSPAEERLERRHQEQLAEQRAGREEKRFDKMVYPKLAKADEKAESATRENLVLDEIERLTRAGNEQKTWALITDHLKDRTGIDATALLNADTTEMNKLTQFFLKDLKNTFGGRITNLEMEQFMLGVPRLMMNPEGRLRIVNVMKLFNEVSIKRYDIMQDVAEKHPNATPIQFDALVNKRMKDVYKDAEEQFKSVAKSSSLKGHSVGQKMKKLPDIKEVPVGSKVRTSTGEILISDGTSWKKEAKE